VEKQLGGGPLDESVMLVDRHGIEMVTPNKNERFTGGEILAVTASVVGEDRREEEGRYVIWKTPEGRFRTSWLNESVVEMQFAKAGVSLPTEAFLQQPSTLDASPDYMMRKYAQENFKDPKNPTIEEVEKMKADLAERFSDKLQSTPTPAVTPITHSSTEQLALAASPVPMVAEEESVPAHDDFPILPVAIIAALIVGGAVFLLRRKS
jgi:hypothetical protein